MSFFPSPLRGFCWSSKRTQSHWVFMPGGWSEQELIDNRTSYSSMLSSGAQAASFIPYLYNAL